MQGMGQEEKKDVNTMSQTIMQFAFGIMSRYEDIDYSIPFAAEMDYLIPAAPVEEPAEPKKLEQTQIINLSIKLYNEFILKNNIMRGLISRYAGSPPPEKIILNDNRVINRYYSRQDNNYHYNSGVNSFNTIVRLHRQSDYVKNTVELSSGSINRLIDSTREYKTAVTGHEDGKNTGFPNILSSKDNTSAADYSGYTASETIHLKRADTAEEENAFEKKTPATAPLAINRQYGQSVADTVISRLIKYTTAAADVKMQGILPRLRDLSQGYKHKHESGAASPIKQLLDTVEKRTASPFVIIKEAGENKFTRIDVRSFKSVTAPFTDIFYQIIKNESSKNTTEQTNVVSAGYSLKENHIHVKSFTDEYKTVINQAAQEAAEDRAKTQSLDDSGKSGTPLLGHRAEQAAGAQMENVTKSPTGQTQTSQADRAARTDRAEPLPLQLINASAPAQQGDIIPNKIPSSVLQLIINKNTRKDIRKAVNHADIHKHETNNENTYNSAVLMQSITQADIYMNIAQDSAIETSFTKSMTGGIVKQAMSKRGSTIYDTEVIPGADIYIDTGSELAPSVTSHMLLPSLEEYKSPPPSLVYRKETEPQTPEVKSAVRRAAKAITAEETTELVNKEIIKLKDDILAKLPSSRETVAAAEKTSLDTLPIGKLADKVYKELETRLRFERIKRGTI